MQQKIKHFRRHLQLAFVVPLVLAALLGSIFVVQTYYLRQALKDVEHSYIVQMRARSLLKLMLDMETGLRGYLLTGDRQLLQPYRDSAPHVGPALDELQQLTHHDPRQTELMKQFGDNYQRWHADSSHLIDMRENGQDVSSAAVNMRGKQIMDAIRVARDEMLRIEEAKLTDHLARVRRTMTSLFVTAVVLSLFLGLLLATFSRRELAAVASSYDSALRTAQNTTEDLKESQQWLSGVLGSIGDGVLATDGEGHIVFSNDVAEHLLGREYGDLTNRNTTEVIRLVEEYTREAVPDLFREVMYSQNHYTSPGHTLLLRHDGSEIPVSATASPIRGDGKINGVVIVIRDLTEQRQSERSLQSAEKLAIIGRLAASVAHEIHNPLDAMGNILYLLEHGTLDETSKTYVRLAREELERVTSISEQMLTFSRESRVPVSVKISDIIDNVMTLFNARIRRMGVTVVKECDPSLSVTAFPGELRQVFSNLIGNALDAMPGPGKLVIRTEQAHTWNEESERGVRVLVCDNGSGIPREVRPKLMDPFVTSKGEKGTGLGLWVCRGIVEKYHGSLRYRTSTTPGHSGTCFSVFLPYNAPQEQSSEARERVS
ncbi:MAG TPA: CHASE3 domain-containing protein [Terriglobales bacterium]|nr:CHASE3 domain-containing protein [Terriglobales bacterium]